MRSIQRITKDQLVSKLQEIDGHKASFISFVAVTDARLKKTNNPYSGVRKASKVYATLNFNYQNAVNSQRLREGKENDFQSKERVYGVKTDEFNGCLLFGANDVKLIVKVNSTLKPKYLYEGKIIDRNKIKDFLPVIKPTSQELEKEVIYRNYDLSNIKKLTVNSITYKII